MLPLKLQQMTLSLGWTPNIWHLIQPHSLLLLLPSLLVLSDRPVKDHPLLPPPLVGQLLLKQHLWRHIFQRHSGKCSISYWLMCVCMCIQVCGIVLFCVCVLFNYDFLKWHFYHFYITFLHPSSSIHTRILKHNKNGPSFLRQEVFNMSVLIVVLWYRLTGWRVQKQWLPRV